VSRVADMLIVKIEFQLQTTEFKWQLVSPSHGLAEAKEKQACNFLLQCYRNFSPEVVQAVLTECARQRSRVMSVTLQILMSSVTVLLGKWPTWRTNSFQCIYLFTTLCIFQARRAHHQERQIVLIQLLVTVTPCLLPTNIRHGHQDGVTVMRSCINTICLSWW
jgi:hypothetical protein